MQSTIVESDTINDLRDEISARDRIIASMQETINDRDDAISDLENKVDRLEDKVFEIEENTTADEEIEALVAVRKHLKNGDIVKAIQALDDALHRLDDCWSNRTGIVPGQGVLL